MPWAWSAAIISCRPERAKWSGKKPRLPTRIPSTIAGLEDSVMASPGAIFANACNAELTALSLTLSSLPCPCLLSSTISTALKSSEILPRCAFDQGAARPRSQPPFGGSTLEARRKADFR